MVAGVDASRHGDASRSIGFCPARIEWSVGRGRAIMIEFIFTLDYEIYGNGQGSLRKLVLDPTQRLAEVFEEFDAPFVVFAEAVEFAKIEEARSDPDITAVRAQLRELRTGGHEIGLHLHPWWAGA